MAVLHDPLVGAICSPDEVWSMVDEMLVAQSKWLPQYKNDIEKTKKRIINSNVKKKNWDGAARMKVRNINELQHEKKSNIIR